MSRTTVIAFLLWSIALGSGAYLFGRHEQANADKAQQLEVRENENELTRLKNRKALASGIRTEKKQAKTDAFFQGLRIRYENDQKQDPAAGCLLDDVSLRRWNEANAQSTDAAAGEPDAADAGHAATVEEGRERGE